MTSDVTAVDLRRIDGMDAVIEWGVPLVDLRGMKGNANSLSGLMERYADGDDGVFEAVYHGLSTPLYRFCLRLTTHWAEADDLFQETFLKMHRARATYAPGSNPLHWSYAIARSLYLSSKRLWRRRPEILGASDDVAEHDDIHVDAAATPESEVLADHLLDVVSLELERMSEKNRSAYVLLKEEGLSAKDAAVLLGTTPDTVKQRAHRAYMQLKAALGDAGWKEYDGRGPGCSGSPHARASSCRSCCNEVARRGGGSGRGGVGGSRSVRVLSVSGLSASARRSLSACCRAFGGRRVSDSSLAAALTARARTGPWLPAARSETLVSKP